MIRDTTEIFGKDLWVILEKLGVSSPDTNERQSFQLMKFERMTPDVFVWMLRNDETYIVTISDIETDHPDNSFLANRWLAGKVNVNQIETLTDNDGNIHIKDNFDTIIVRRLPHDFDLDLEDLYYET